MAPLLSRQTNHNWMHFPRDVACCTNLYSIQWTITAILWYMRICDGSTVTKNVTWWDWELSYRKWPIILPFSASALWICDRWWSTIHSIQFNPQYPCTAVSNGASPPLWIDWITNGWCRTDVTVTSLVYAAMVIPRNNKRFENFETYSKTCAEVWRGMCSSYLQSYNVLLYHTAIGWLRNTKWPLDGMKAHLWHNISFRTHSYI